MVRAAYPVDRLRVASPCHASWADMAGDDRARFCRECHKHVYNLSALSAAEAQDLIEAKEGRLCVRFYQREDGTVLTEDCPVGVRALTRRVFAVGAIAVSIVLAVLGVAGGLALAGRDAGGQGGPRPGAAISPWTKMLNWLFPGQAGPPPVVMGEICPPPVRPGKVEEIAPVP